MTFTRAPIQFSLWLCLSLSLLVGTLSLSEQFFIKFDYSEGARYTLSPQMTSLLKELNDSLVIKAYLPLSGAPIYRDLARHTLDLLSELKSLHSLIRLEVIDISTARSHDERLELIQEAKDWGVKTAQLLTEQKGYRELLELPFGIAWTRQNQRVVTGAVEQIHEIEYQFMLALQQLLEHRPKPRLGIAQGQGEPDLIHSPLAKRLESEGQLISIDLNTQSTNEDLDVLLVFGATQSYGELARWQIDQVLCAGGGVVIALDHREQSHLFTQVWSSRPTGLEPLLKRYQIESRPQWVIADPVHQAPAPLSRDAHDQVVFAPHPLYPLAQASDHLISSSFSELTIPMSAWFKIPAQAQILFRSSPQALALRGLKSLNIQEARESFQAKKGFPLAFAIEFKVEQCLERPAKVQMSSPEMIGASTLQNSSYQSMGRLVVIGSGRRLLSANPLAVEFLLNAIAWSRGDSKLLELKKGRHHLKRFELSSSKQKVIQVLSLFIPSCFLLLISIYLRRSVKKGEEE